MKKHNRMPRAEKDTSNAKNAKDSKEARVQRKKRGSGANDDDDEVDSKGNIRGLIAYSDETDEEESPRISRRGFKPRKAAVVAKEKIKAKLQAPLKKPLETKKHVDARRRPEKPRLRKYVSEEETSISEDEDADGTEEDEEDADDEEDEEED